jgi:outer membrane murein-binding lipoprotein Lpp
MSFGENAARCAVIGGVLLAATPAAAASNAEIVSQVDALKQQIEQLQQQLQAVQNQVQSQQQQPPAPPPVTPIVPTGSSLVTSSRAGQLDFGHGVTLQLGGFAEAASIYRSRNETADVGSDFNGGIPFANNPKNQENEFRFSARQSRLSGLVNADIDQDTHAGLYVESDFLGAGDPSNSRESNSFTPRLRQFYATLDRDDWGFHFLAGQAWSLLTTNTQGIGPRDNAITPTIDAQYIVGFNWARQTQLRFVEDFGNGLWAGVSLENPQASIGGSAPPGFTTGTPTAANASFINANNLGDQAGLFSNDQTFSTDTAPDIVAKVAFDPGFGHYELKGIARFFTDREFSELHGGSNNTVLGGGGGAAAIIPVVPKYVDLQISGLAGYGIGRYGSGQLNDVTFSATGSLVPLPEVQGLFGILAHPLPGTELYSYFGYEQADRTASSNGAGFGSQSLNNTVCFSEADFNTTCPAVTHRLEQIVLGGWQDLYKGSFGRVAVGLEGSYEKKFTFSANGGVAPGVTGPAPNVDEAIFMSSFRYYPF